MKKVVLLGAGGQLGYDLSRVIKQDPSFFLFPLTHQQCDITNVKTCQKILRSIKPDIVINTAAYHRVDEAESNPQKAFHVNTIATGELARICEEEKITYAFISTDYVFGQDSKRKRPYRENDLTGPINVYGNSKLGGENFIKSVCSKCLIIRSAGLFGIAGASGKGGNFVELMLRRARENGHVSVVADQVTSPTYTLNLAQKIKELLDIDAHGLFHATSEGECSWYSFAKKIFELTRTKVKLKAVDSKTIGAHAKRPSYSVLVNSNLEKLKLSRMNSWEKNLKSYLLEKGYI